MLVIKLFESQLVDGLDMGADAGGVSPQTFVAHLAKQRLCTAFEPVVVSCNLRPVNSSITSFHETTYPIFSK